MSLRTASTELNCCIGKETSYNTFDPMSLQLSHVFAGWVDGVPSKDISRKSYDFATCDCSLRSCRSTACPKRVARSAKGWNMSQTHTHFREAQLSFELYMLYLSKLLPPPRAALLVNIICRVWRCGGVCFLREILSFYECRMKHWHIASLEASVERCSSSSSKFFFELNIDWLVCSRAQQCTRMDYELKSNGTVD